MTPFADIRELSFAYNGEPVLQDITLTVDEGDFVAVVGPNGGGKSTLLKLMLGLIGPYQGSLRIRGREVAAGYLAGDIGYVPQQYAAGLKDFPATVAEVVALGCVDGRSFPWRRQPRRGHIVRHMLALVGMSEYAGSLVGDLSGGQQQRVMVARALAGNPSALLLDEPASGVDFAAREQLYALLSWLNRTLAVTVVMVSHDIDKALQCARKIACINNGLCYFGPPSGFTTAHMTGRHGQYHGV